MLSELKKSDFLDYPAYIIEEHADSQATIDLEDTNLNEIIKSLFIQKGIKKLYDFQYEGIKKGLAGKNLVIVAPTGSGKTEIYLSIAITKALNGERSLFLYPTKALSRDQSQRLSAFSLYGINYAIYDGDTKQFERKKIRENPPKILISNVDMLHHILLNHSKFDKFFKDLGVVVLDELHYYDGILGSHVGNIFRRLSRIMRKKYGKKLQYITTSATISNAKEFASTIFGIDDFEEIKSTKSFRNITYVIVEPFESYITASLRIAEQLNKKTLIFANSHAVAEKISYIGKHKGLKIETYRAGLTYEKRRKIEENFKKGNIRILSTTSALELGIDIGDVEVVILAGFPGGINNLKQRAGRAGRRGQKSYAIIIPRESPLDQYFVENPLSLFQSKPESCYANPDNEEIKKIHTIAKAQELMLIEGEENLDKLVEIGLIKKIGNFYVPTSKGKELVRTLNLRGVGEKIYIYEGNRRIGEREYHMAIKELYEGAIYFLGGKAFISKGIDFEQKKAMVEFLGEVEYYTNPLTEREIEIKEVYENKEYNDFLVSWGKVYVTDRVIGYSVKDQYSNRTLTRNYFSIPYTYEFTTEAIWLDLGEYFDIENFAEGLHGYEHVFINMTPAVSGNSANELGGLSYPNGRMFVYESIGNIGLSKILFHRFEEIAKMTKERLNSCKCSNGCPKCIFDPRCGNDNNYLDKTAAIEISNLIFEKI